MAYIPAIVSGNLPIELPGPHAVGYASLRHAPHHSYTLPVPHIASKTGSKDDTKRVPALGVRQVEYSIYYPCEKPAKGWFWQKDSPGTSVSWLPRPIEFILDGYRRFANDHPLMKAASPILKLAGGRLSVPLFPNAPLLGTSSSKSSLSDPAASAPSNKPQLVIFSHGLAGTKNAYSAVCSALASQGHVVLAVAHADGSAPGVILHSQGDEQQQEIRLEYLKCAELDWAPEQTPELMHLRSLQLSVRVAEIYEAFYSFATLVNKGPSAFSNLHLYTDDGPPPPPVSSSSSSSSSSKSTPHVHTKSDTTRQEAKVAWLDTWKSRVNLQDLTLVGHSFGGGTLLHLLQIRPPQGFEKLPVKKAVALDPWVDPLPMPGPPKELVDRDTPQVPLLVINSEGFTVWSTHFKRISGLVEKARGSLVSIIGCDHQTFSDFPLLLIAPTASKILRTINSLVTSFSEDNLRENPAIKGKVPDEGRVKLKTDPKSGGGGGRKLEGDWGEVVVHQLG